MKFIIIIFLCCSNIASAQYWSKHFDLANGNEFGTTVVLAEDGVLAVPLALCNTNTVFCKGLFKVDFDGNLVWKYVVVDSINGGRSGSLAMLGDTILLNGEYSGAVGQVKDMLITLLDTAGNYLGAIDYWQPGLNESGQMIRVTPDRIYAQFNLNDTTKISSPRRGHVRAFDRAFNELFDVEYPKNQKTAITGTLEVTPDGGFAVAYPAIRDGRWHFFIEKYDKNGNFQKEYKHPRSYFPGGRFVRFITDSEGGYYGIWRTDTFGYFTPPPNQTYLYPNPPMVFKMDSLGNLLWEKIFLTANLHEYYHLFLTKNGDIVVCGEDMSFQHINAPDLYSGYISRLDPNGVVRWQRTIRDERDGGPKFALLAGVELKNGDFIFTGDHERFFDVNNPEPPYDLWLIKVDSNGCFTPDCGRLQFLTHSIDPPFEKETVETFVAYPNPFQDVLHIGSLLGQAAPTGDYAIRVFDWSGRLVVQDDFNPNFIHRLDTKQMPSGTYFIVVYRNNDRYQVIKAIKP